MRFKAILLGLLVISLLSGFAFSAAGSINQIFPASGTVYSNTNTLFPLEIWATTSGSTVSIGNTVLPTSGGSSYTFQAANSLWETTSGNIITYGNYVIASGGSGGMTYTFNSPLSLNGNVVSLLYGGNVFIDSRNFLDAISGSGSGGCGLCFLNGLSGNVQIQGAGASSVTTSGQNIIVTSSGGAGSSSNSVALPTRLPIP